MSLLICTPMYGGNCTEPYFLSCLSLQAELINAGMDHNWLTTANESLIPRARNTSVTQFLNTDYECLLFIDADLQFTPEDVSRLWNLDADVAVAAYPMKRPDTPLSAWRNGKLVDITDEIEPFEVDFAGTGFMLIKRHVFDAMIKCYPSLTHEESVGRTWALFDTMIWNDTYLSEDYAFCKRWRDIGGKVICDPTIKLIHWGSYGYDAG